MSGYIKGVGTIAVYSFINLFINPSLRLQHQLQIDSFTIFAAIVNTLLFPVIYTLSYLSYQSLLILTNLTR